MWSFLWNNCLAHGYIRYPLCCVPPIVWNSVTGDFFEAQFKLMNAGHNQIDIWQRLAKKVAEDGGAVAEE